jgi:hypothetical protein
VAEGRLNTKGRAVASKSKTGRGVVTAPIFLLVPQVKLPKRLDLARDAERAVDGVPGLIVANWVEGCPPPDETVLAALHARLQPLAALTLRDEVLPERIPTAGLIILRDGQPGEPEVTLSPLRYHYQHRAELEVVVQAGTGRASAFDTLIAAIGAALEADRTLGGLCDWVEPEAPASVDLPIEGAAALKAAVITVVLHYTTTGPLA